MKETGGYIEREGRRVEYRIFAPEGNPVALLQIAQDGGENLSFYRALAEQLTHSGVIVFGCSYPGHEIDGEGLVGHFGEGKALEVLLEDQKAIYDFMRKKYRYLPHVLLGHGIGSIVVRLFMERYHECTDGVVLAAPLAPKGSLFFSGLLCRITALISGKEKRAASLEERLFGKTSIPAEKTDGLALCTPLSVASYCQILSAQRKVTFEEFGAELEQGLPVFIFAGEEDPLGGGAQTALSLHEQLSMAELCTLSIKIYEKAGHWLHLSHCREQYFTDLEEFIKGVAEGVMAARSATYY